MPTFMKPKTIDDVPEVKAAWTAWQEAKTRLDETTARVKHLKRLLHPDYGLATDEIEQIEAQSSLPVALKVLGEGMKAERQARLSYEQARQAETRRLGQPLKEKLAVVLKEREQVMNTVILADQKVRAVYEEAVALLGQSQTIIPSDLGLPWLSSTNGSESWWDYLKEYCNRQVQDG